MLLFRFCSAFAFSEAKHFEVDFLSLEEFPMAVSYFERVEQVVQIADTAPDWFTEHLNAPASEIIRKTDPCEALKAAKNEIEQKGSWFRASRAVQSSRDPCGGSLNQGDFPPGRARNGRRRSMGWKGQVGGGAVSR